MNGIKNIDEQNIKCLTPNNDGHYFFGYYDKNPRDKSGRFFLAHKVGFIDRMPKNGELAEICVIDLEKDNELKKIAETRAWNWQMGSMLQWLGPDFDKKIIFNDLLGGKFISVVYDLDSKFSKAIDFPVYAVHPSGRHALSLDFSRLSKLREGYGYWGLEKTLKKLERAPSDDGIYLVDLENNKMRLLISLKQISELNYSGIMEKGFHWVEHLTFNPSGSRFVFIHRFQLENNRVYSRLISASADGSDMRVLLDTGMASHFYWRNDREILIWARAASFAGKMEKKASILKYLIPIYHMVIKNFGFLTIFFRQKIVGDCFLLIEDRVAGNIKKIGEGVIIEDGHCVFLPNKNKFACDTYPDSGHFRTLFIFDMNLNTKKDIGKFYSLPAEEFKGNCAGDWRKWDIGGMRCDLHPRWVNDGICFDSVHEGSRKIYVYNLEN